MKIEISESQVLVLKSLLIQEIDYLESSIKDTLNNDDKKGLQAELDACKDLLEQIK